MARRGQTGRFVPNYKKIEYMKNHKLYKGKYRTQTLRWTKCAYREGTYFVTINSKGYNWPFGHVVNGEMQHSQAGQVVCRNWMVMAEHFPYVQIDEVIVMPDHTHALLTLHNVPRIAHPVQAGGCTGYDSAGIKPGLGQIIRWFKARTSYEIKAFEKNFCWQRRYYDVVIHSPRHKRAVCRYIQNNPRRWNKTFATPTTTPLDNSQTDVWNSSRTCRS